MVEYVIYADVPERNQHVRDFISRSGGEYLGCVDRNPAKWDSDKKMYAPSFIAKHPRAKIVITSFDIERIAQYIRQQGWMNEILVYPYWRTPFFVDTEHNPRSWGEANRERLLQIYDKRDSCNLAYIEELVRQRVEEFAPIRLQDVWDYLPYERYFVDDALISREDDVTFVDCGAYDGDTIADFQRNFGKRLKKVYAFEPNPQTYSSLQQNLRSMGLCDLSETFCCGVSDQPGSVRFTQNKTMSFIDPNGTIEIAIRTLDDCVGEVTGSLYIKMDIEGFEIPALRGAARLIEKYHPYMAICTYHKWDDYIEIPETIKAIRDDYEFYLRGGMHSICHAVPR